MFLVNIVLKKKCIVLFQFHFSQEKLILKKKRFEFEVDSRLQVYCEKKDLLLRLHDLIGLLSGGVDRRWPGIHG